MTSDPDTTETEKKSRPASQFLGPLIVICCAGWGLALGMYIWSPQTTPVPTTTPETAPQDTAFRMDAPDNSGRPVEPTPDEDKVEVVSVRQLQLIDVMLTHGNVAQALDAYSSMAPEVGTVLHDQLIYRMSVARETLGQLAAARKMYARLVSQTVQPELYVAAQMGQARVAMKSGRAQFAQQSIARTLLDSTTILPVHSPLHGELAHLHALSHLQFDELDTEVVFDTNRPVTTMPEWRPSKLLELAEPAEAKDNEDGQDSESDEDARPEARDVVEVVYRYGQHPSEIQVTAELSETSVIDIINRLVQAGDLTLEWSEDALREVKRRSLAFDSMPVTLAVALDRVLDTFALGWTYAEGKLTIKTFEEIPDEELVNYHRAIAGRLTRHALASYTEHPLARYAYLALGNLAYEQKSFPKANSVYKQFEEKYPYALELVSVHFNRGKSDINTGDRDHAIKSFFQAADGGHGHPLQSPANLFAGKLLLESGKIIEAPRALIRAVSTATSPQHKGRATVVLAAAYLMADNAHAAAQVLLDGRDGILGDEDFERLATFANCYAQFKVAKAQVDITISGRNLVDSLSGLPDVAELGDFWHLLFGAAFREVGLSSQTELVYKSALKTEISPWTRHEMEEELVKHWRLRGDDEALREWFAERETPDDDVKTALRMAELALKDGDTKGCRERCREALEHADSAQKQQALRLMGKSYRAENEHYKAALCFAGMLPGDGAQIRSPNANPAAEDAK